ncbi:MAG: 16S rRNA (guanine(527)-N(7))-methyltransferase RsmG [Terracidiphilus sp.]
MNPGEDSEANVCSLNNQLEAAGLKPLNAETSAKFEIYLSLILRWNARMNLTAIRDPKEILSRHFVESIACAQALPSGITTLLDFGSGAGFPGIPIALCRPEISVTLAESQSRKAAFLQEVVRSLKLSSRVFAGRAETLEEQFDYVALRAVDRMEQAVAAASELVRAGGWLAVFTTRRDLAVLESAGANLQRSKLIPIAGSDQRVLVLASKTGA